MFYFLYINEYNSSNSLKDQQLDKGLRLSYRKRNERNERLRASAPWHRIQREE